MIKMNFDYEVSYRKESEIDKAFDYIDELDAEIKKLRGSNSLNYNKLYSIFSFKKIYNDSPIIKTQRIKSHNYMKDGYEFRIIMDKVFTEKSKDKIAYYIFYVNVRYNSEKRIKQLYQEFNKLDDVKKHYKNMEGVFKLLKRRDLIERIFDFKLKEIEKLK